MKGEWKGVYTQYLNENEFLEIDFEMMLNENEDGFNGICQDLEIEIGTKEKSSIRGFCEDSMISFIKVYENAIYLDRDTNEFVLDQENSGRDIHYYGTYNHDTEQFEGSWEIETSEDQIAEEKMNIGIEYGSWFMKRQS